MAKFLNNYRLFNRFCASVLAVFHLLTFGPISDALAFNAQSQTYQLTTSSINSGGRDRDGAIAIITQDSIAESSIGFSQSFSFILDAGFIPTIQSNPPALKQIIPNQTWPEDTSLTNAFDLDDYFISDTSELEFTFTGNYKINVAIDLVTHLVSFSQPQSWFGVEKIRFTATDIESDSTESNEITLQVEGVNNAPILDYIPDITVNENELVTITPHASDLDGGDITYSFTSPLDSTGKWQTDYRSSGVYLVTVTAKDTADLLDTQEVEITIKNVNRAPILNPIPDISSNEGDLITVEASATDPDNDAISLYYSTPLDSTGKWLTDNDDAGTYTATVTASDGIDTVSKTVNITVANVNRAPDLSLYLAKYTVTLDELINANIFVNDPDGDTMTFSLRMDDQEIASGSIVDIYTKVISFTAIGDHTVTATITDSYGLSKTESRGVDVVDPNANRDFINPVMGDFNGDSLSDLGLHNSQTGTWEICISDEGVFRNAVDWLTGFGSSRDFWPLGGDFNGDAKTDIAIYNNVTGELKIALSNGSGFNVSNTALNFSEVSYSWQAATGNFNGDKFTDFSVYNKDTGEVRVALGTGTGFSAFTTWLNNSDTGYILLTGEFNGDGLTDICLFGKSSGEFKVVFSNTKSFIDTAVWISGYMVDKDPILSDFNNDSLTDIGYWDKSSFNWFHAIATGEKFLDKGVYLDSFGSIEDESGSTGDFNGDGVTDRAIFDRDEVGIIRWEINLSTRKPSDLLTDIDNGIGGKTKATYTYASKFDSELPFPVYVASAISLIDTLPIDKPEEIYTQNFSYYDGYYDATEREFRGFNRVKAHDPITNNYTETYFYQGKLGQDAALKGQIEKVFSYDANNRKISETLNTYEVKKAGPEDKNLGFPALIEQLSTVWEENDTSLTTKNRYVYDSIGNVLEEITQGELEKIGDEKSAATIYAQAYTVGFNRPIESSLKDKDGNIVSKKSFEYDTNGNLIKDTTWIFDPLSSIVSHPSSSYSYDSFGNLTSTINDKGSVVTTDYETAFYTYPEKTTNSFGHTVEYVYDPKFGVVTQATGPNGVISGTEYDSLARIVQKTMDEGGGTKIIASYSYPDFNTKITTNAIAMSATEYIDGLGRKYKIVSQAEDESSLRNVSTETYYNNRGFVEKESLAHYVDEDESNISYIRYVYDTRGRIKETISDFPGTSKDAESIVNYIEPLYTEAIDPLGHKKGVRKDIYGNNIEIIEFTLGGVYHTYYEYDIQNNLIKLTDSKNNSTQLYYDSIGKKLKMIDPDMGTWLYEYDSLGNLVKQTDAKNQALEFEYDQLNRLINKSSLRGEAEAISVQYIYDDASKPNCIGRLSKITDLSGSTEFFYDKLGREIKSIKSLRGAEGDEAISYTVEREYDILDRLTKLTYPDGETVTYTYDSNSGLLESLQGAKGAEASGLTARQAISYVQDITYNAKGQIKAIKYGNNTKTDYTYGQDLRLSKILTTDENQGKTLQDLNYIFDGNGNITTLTNNLRPTDKTQRFFYDDLERLTSAEKIALPQGGYGAFNYQYDSIGNMTNKSDVGSMSYGFGAGPHALTSAGGYSYRYDANGNMIQGKNKTLEYDAENRLTSVSESGTITTFTYDGDGGRVKKTSLRGEAEAISTTYIGSLFEIETDGIAPEKVRKHIFAGANRVATVSLREGEADEAISYYHADHLGSSSVITDQTGQQVQSCEYTPYGTLTRNEGTDVVTHKFTGKELDNTGLYFYGARYYDPEIGRFITSDPTIQHPFDPQDLNRYAYCRNNPINYADPSGLGWKKFFQNVAAGFVAGVTFVATGGNVVLAGMAYGAVMGGFEGGWKGAFIGAGMGALTGATMGLGIAVFGPSFGIAAFVGGAAYTYHTQGLEGLGYMAGGMIGSIAGYQTGNAIGEAISKGPNLASQSGSARVGSGNNTTKAANNLETDKKPIISPNKVNSNTEVEIKTKGEGPYLNQKIYRVFGDGAKWDGKSWTPVNPDSVPNYRVQAGLPNVNSGRFVAEARITQIDNIIVREAIVVYGNGDAQMVQEYVILDPKNQVTLERISGANPEY